MKSSKRKTKRQYDADDLARRILGLTVERRICLADSCGVSHLGSRFLIAGIGPFREYAVKASDATVALRLFDGIAADPPHFSFFTLAYDLGLKINRLPIVTHQNQDEPDIFLASFRSVVVHDYFSGETFLQGDESEFDRIEDLIENALPLVATPFDILDPVEVYTNFTRSAYIGLVEQIRELIRRGDTYQTNLTQQLTARLGAAITPAQVFHDLRSNHPAPFGSFIDRGESVIVSASPERFFKVYNECGNRFITTSPIKGTRPRGIDPKTDAKLRRELLESAKDRAENVMIVDLLRNDLGRICEFGSVEVEKLCDLEEHPSLFHLVSTVCGRLRSDITPAEILRAVFPCGSITGAPKISTMRIIGELENRNRGLSMGAIGFSGPAIRPFTSSAAKEGFEMDLSVAIRTMTMRDGVATFNVGGGIVIDSDAANEYDETLTKAGALLRAINGKLFPEQISVTGV